MAFKICLDAGHYNKYNKSPVNTDYYESEFSWKFHLLLKAELEKYENVTVITTRTDQKKDLALEERGKRSDGCNLFMSIHSNACDDHSVDYPLACCCVDGRMNALGKRLADMVARVMQTRQNGRILTKRGTGGNDWYGVLRGAAKVGTPGILLEHSFHTCARPTNWLLNDANLKVLAVEEAKELASYYGLKLKTNATQTTTPAPTEQKPQSTVTKTPSTFLVKVTCNALNVRRGPGVNYEAVTIVTKNQVYTIVDTKNGWGLLKSGAGWINISSAYVTKL